MHGLSLKIKLVLSIIALVLSFTIPFWCFSNYFLNILNVALIFVIASIGYDFIFGHVGQVSFAQTVFFGIGSYTVAIVTTKMGVPTVVAYLIGIMISLFLAILLGYFIFRLKGHYLAIATLGLAQIFQLFVVNQEITGGVFGISNIPSPTVFGIEIISPVSFYYFLLPFVLISIVAAWFILNSRYGRIFSAMNDSEFACSSLGVNVKSMKVFAFCLSALWGTVAGGLFSQLSGYISPESYGLNQVIIFLAMLIIGGRSSILGAVSGAILISFLPEWLRFLDKWYIVVYAIALIIIITIAPRGIIGIIDNLLHRYFYSRFKRGMKVSGNDS